MERKKQVVVIGNNLAEKLEKEIAYKTGKIIGESGVVLITGGKYGVMKHVSRGAKESGGFVISILPNHDFDDTHEFNDVVIPTGIGYARNLVNVLAGDLIIAIGGGAGTLSEIAYAWQFKKTIFAYTCVNGWSHHVGRMQKIDNKHKKNIYTIDSISDFERQYFNWLNNFSL